MGYWGSQLVNFFLVIGPTTFGKSGTTDGADGDNGAGEKSSVRERRSVA